MARIRLTRNTFLGALGLQLVGWDGDVDDVLAADLVGAKHAEWLTKPAWGPDVPTPTSAQVRAMQALLGGGPRGLRNVEAWSTPLGLGSVSGLAASQTWQLQFATMKRSYGARVIFSNNTPADLVIDKTTIQPSTTYVAGGAATGGAPPVNILTGGVAANTVPLTASTALHNYSATDWTAIVPRDRTDVVGAPDLWHIRPWIQTTTGYRYETNLTNHAGYAGNSATGLVRQGGFVAGDKTDGSGAVANVSLFLRMIVEFRTTLNGVMVMGLGDSLMASFTLSDGGILSSVGSRACALLNSALSNPGLIYSFVNAGFPSQTHAEIYARLPALLTVHQPNVVLLPTYSPNTPAANQAEMDANTERVRNALYQVRTAGAVPVLYTGMPKDSMSSAQDAIRRASNAMWRTIAAAERIALADWASLVGNSEPAGVAETWRAEYSSDGLHPMTPAAGDVLAAELARAMAMR